MNKIILISCVSKKEKTKSKVKNLYKGPLFKYSLNYAKSLNSDNIFVISALHHLLDLEEEILPYDITLSKVPKSKQKEGLKVLNSSEKIEWGKKVIEKLQSKFDLKNDKFIFLAGNEYIKPIIPYLINWEAPLNGLKIGQRIKFLKNTQI
jgi:hypothetical protein